VIGIFKTSEKAKSNSVYPTLLRGEKCLSYKIGEKCYNLKKTGVLNCSDLTSRGSSVPKRKVQGIFVETFWSFKTTGSLKFQSAELSFDSESFGSETFPR